MSFPIAARKARDPARTVWVRLSALKGCVRSFAFLTGLSYNATLERLGLTWSRFIPREPPTDAFLRRTLDELERERNLYLQAFRGLELRRVRAKMQGRRQLSRAERDARAELRLRAEAAVERVAQAANIPSAR